MWSPTSPEMEVAALEAMSGCYTNISLTEPTPRVLLEKCLKSLTQPSRIGKDKVEKIKYSRFSVPPKRDDSS